MDSIRGYLLSIACAAIICTIASAIVGKKGANASIVRLISGVIMLLTLISPLVKVRILDFTDYATDISNQADAVVAQGENSALSELSAIIKAQTEAYILDKAVSLKLDIKVEVTLDGGKPPMPNAVKLSGSASPYAKEMLSNFIANDLAIPKEAQQWI